MELSKLLQSGRKIKIFFNEGNINNKTIHIRAIVDDEIIVFRSWHKSKQMWVYYNEHIFYFELLNEHGNLK